MCYYCQSSEGECSKDVYGELTKCQMEDSGSLHYGNACVVGHTGTLTIVMITLQFITNLQNYKYFTLSLSFSVRGGIASYFLTAAHFFVGEYMKGTQGHTCVRSLYFFMIIRFLLEILQLLFP